MKAAPNVNTTTTRSGRLRRTAPAFAAFAGLAVFLAACGGGTSEAGSGSKSPAKSAAGGGLVAFSQCMRSHGVTDFPDPQNGHFLINGNVQSNPNFGSARQACQHLAGPGGVGNGGGNSSALLALAHCMQAHGVPQFPDPSANGALNVQGVNPNSPAFKSAWAKCQSKAPAGIQGQQP
jgi:hypothetical protein